MADDKLAAVVEDITRAVQRAEGAGMSGDLDEVIYTHGLMTGTSRRLLTALDAVLKLHGSAAWYLGADGCDHPEPPGDSSERDAWEVEHQYGSNGERICLLEQIGSYCAECTTLVYGDETYGEEYIPAPCVVRQAITRELTGTEP